MGSSPASVAVCQLLSWSQLDTQINTGAATKNKLDCRQFLALKFGFVALLCRIWSRLHRIGSLSVIRSPGQEHRKQPYDSDLVTLYFIEAIYKDKATHAADIPTQHLTVQHATTPTKADSSYHISTYKHSREMPAVGLSISDVDNVEMKHLSSQSDFGEVGEGELGGGGS